MLTATISGPGVGWQLAPSNMDSPSGYSTPSMKTSTSLTPARPTSAGPLVALGLLALIWGYNWVVMKSAMAYVGPMDFAAWRGVLGTLLLFGVLWAVRAPLRPKHVVKTIFLGLFQTAGFVGLISWALNIGAAGKSAVLGYTMPFWVIVFGWPFLPDRLRGWQWPAAGLILVGLVLVLELWAGSTDTTSSLLALGAGISWAISVIIFKRIPVESRNDLLSVTAWQMVYGMLPLVVIAWLTDERPIVWSGYFIGALAYNAVGGMAIATLLWLYILQRLPATISGLNALAVPIVGVIAAWIQLGERPSLAEGGGMLLILSGLALLTSTQRNVQP
jgi:drug/metabolite transporter (DMT)-like permease